MKTTGLRITRRLSTFAMAAAVLSAALGAASPAAAESKQVKAANLVDKASETVEFFLGDEPYAALRDYAGKAKAVVIIPTQYRGGFIFGGSGGNAVMLARNEDGTWTYPAFYTIGSFSFGLQAGGEVSELVLLVMTERGKERILSSTVKLGADITAAAGTLGGGAKAQTVDVIAFSRSRGLYGGISVEGAVLKTRPSWNKAYYGAPVSSSDIVFRHAAQNPQADRLRSDVGRLGLGISKAR